MQEVIEQVLDYARGIWRRRWVGLAVAWLVAIIGAAVVWRMPDRYEASARVFVDTQSVLRPLLTGLALAPNLDQEVAILSRTLISRVNVEKVLRKSDLDLAAKTSADRDELIQETMKRLKIARAGGDNLYTLSFQYPDPKKSRDVVQSALSVFMEQSLGDKRQDTESARRFLDEQIRAYEERLREAEGRLQAFRLKYMNVMGGSSKDYLSRMGEVAEEIERMIEVLTASGGIATYTYTLVEGELPDDLILTPTGTLSGTPTTRGSYPFKVQATDSRSGFPFSTQIAYTLEINGPPVVDLGADLIGNEGYEVNFYATYTDEDITATDPVSILWDFGDGSTATDTLTPTHTYGDNGIFDVTLTVTDSLGSVGSDTLVITVGTVKSHLNRIMGKLGARNRTEAVARARALGLVS